MSRSDDHSGPFDGGAHSRLVDYEAFNLNLLSNDPPLPVLVAYPDELYELPRPSTARNPDISPWSDPVDNSSQPVKRSLGFAYKTSLPFARPSGSSTPSVRSRPSDSQSFMSDTYVPSISDVPTISTMSTNDSRKGKASFKVLSDIIKKRSRSKLATDVNDSMSTLGSIPSIPSQLSLNTFMTPYGPSTETLVPPSPPPPPPNKDREKDAKDKSRKRTRLNKPPPPPPKDEPLLTIDTDFAHMEGIVDMAKSGQFNARPTASPSGGFDSSSISLSGFAPPSPSLSVFTNPNPFTAMSSSHMLQYDVRKVSPKTVIGPHDRIPDAEISHEREWTAPESWDVQKEDADALADGASSSSEESVVANTFPTPDDSSTSTDITTKKRMRHKTHHPRKPTSSVSSNRIVLVRIYRANGSYHVAQIPPHATVADLTPSLNAKVVRDHERETHKLYLKERGKERMLAPTERPAAITRRRLEQAGYDQLDSLDYLAAEDMTFLLKFEYKSQLLGPAAEDLNLNSFEYVDLTGRGLPTMPIIFHQNAGAIVYLNLSRNPMVEIPLDFIQSCNTLRELRLSSMAMKKVPQSVRHSASLHRLDLSCNRIVDLDDAGLDRIPELSILKLQNNRMEQLPWYFPRLQALKTLNISNNKFTQFPFVICEMPLLRDLDISFNMITELPEKIGQLKALEFLVFVGNQVSRLPEQCAELVNLRVLDCRRNNIPDLSIAHTLPRLATLLADHNVVHALDLSHAIHSMETLDVSYNDITLLRLVPSALTPSALTSLDVSHTKLSSFDDFALSHLSALQHLKLDHNQFKVLPESLGELSRLITLSCSDNQLDTLPESIGLLQRLETLDAHNNSLNHLPVSLWSCSSLTLINVTSNLLVSWNDPPVTSLIISSSSGTSLEVPASPPASRSLCPLSRRASNATVHSSSARASPPLAYSLEKLYVGENRLTDDTLSPFTILKELRILNLSFNEIQELPSNFLRNLTNLRELYLSGNHLTSIPTEDLPSLTKLSKLFLNGNKLQTLPQELGKLESLTVIDVGSNMLKYNINNYEFDWNWNYNRNLKYLNLSGNKRFEIRPGRPVTTRNFGEDVEKSRGLLADFSELTSLRVLGLMDVTTYLSNIPEETEDRRIRTSLSEVNRMSYGFADNLGSSGYLTMFDLVQPEFRGHRDEAVFAMFGRAEAPQSNNYLSKYLHDHFLPQFSSHLGMIDHVAGETVNDALRRTFLKLNKEVHDALYSGSTSTRKMSQVSASTAGVHALDGSYTRAGASAVVLYFVGKMMHVANVGHALAVVSRQGSAYPVSTKHDPFDRKEAVRIRMAEGWISPKGLVHEEIDTSRSFGFFYHFPVVNARPDIVNHQLEEQDEFVIIGNRGLWDYISPQTAVDIARSEIADPMIAAQKLRDFAISYGSDGSTMIMVICVADLFRPKKQPTADYSLDPDGYGSLKKRAGKKADIANRTIARLVDEVSPPTGHLCLIFTDIRNSTQLWEANPGMTYAMRLHNNLLRRQLRICGGYVVKTEGDAFMCSFPTTLAALWWALIVQVQLLQEPWPQEILECEEGKEVWDSEGNLIARGLSVRMGMHCGTPVCEPDPITNRMDYFGPMVIRAARICGNAAGGQVMCSADVVREINASISKTGPDTEYSDSQPPQAIDAIKRLNIKVIPFGELKLKGMEIPEMVSIIYPESIAGRQYLDLSGGSAVSGSAVRASPANLQWSVAQVRELAVLCLRFEALASGRIFREYPKRKESVPSQAQSQSQPLPRPRSPSKVHELGEGERCEPRYMYGDPDQLLPPIHETMNEPEIAMLLDSLSTRLENAASCLAMRALADRVGALQGRGAFDERTLGLLSSLMRR